MDKWTFGLREHDLENQLIGRGGTDIVVWDTDERVMATAVQARSIFPGVFIEDARGIREGEGEVGTIWRHFD